MSDHTTQSVLFPHLSSKAIVVQDDQAHTSSDGGAVLLKAVDERLGLTAALSAGLVDSRGPGKISHDLEELVRQRIFGFAMGYPDANDSQSLAEDPIQKLLALLDMLAYLLSANVRHLPIGGAGNHIGVRFEGVDAQQSIVVWWLVLLI